MKPTTAIILAAGIGKRFHPLITPKPLFPFMGLTLLERILADLDRDLINQTLIVINPETDSHTKLLVEKYPETKIVTQSNPKGMADAVIACRDSILPNHSILIQNSTGLIDLNHIYSQIKNLTVDTPACVAYQTNQYFPGGYFKVTGREVQVIEKPGPDNMPSNLLKLVYDYIPHPPEFISLLNQTGSVNDDVYELALNQYFSRHQPQIITYKGERYSLKYPHHVLSLSQGLLQSIKHDLSTVQMHPTAVIKPPVYCGQNVRILEHALVKGPVYLGDNALVGNHATIRASMIEANCTIGSYSEVVRSYLGPACQIHRAYAGDSVLESTIHLAAGSVLANRRFDHRHVHYSNGHTQIESNTHRLGAILGANVQVGSQAVLMPGTTVGTNAIIGPGIIAKGYLPPDKKIHDIINTTIE